MKPHRDRQHGTQPDDMDRMRRRHPDEGERSDDMGGMSAPGRTGARRSTSSRGRTSTRSRKKK